MASMSPINTAVGGSAAVSNGGSVSPGQTAPPKNVAFELLFLDSPQYRARLPMRVQIYPHDTTDSIVTTVKNFYGLYAGPAGSKGVSFEDDHGNTLIARYENFRNNMIVYVRVIEGSPVASAAFGSHHYHSASVGEQAYYPGEDYPLPSAQRLGQETTRPNSRSSRRRSRSPGNSHGRRSTSVSTNGHKGRSRSIKNRGSTAHNSVDPHDSMNGYSSGDAAPSSTSGKSKEQLGNTDISVENIVEGGRRKRAKFESSADLQELPLFAPPQMPAATSNPSVSPARRIEHHRPSLPFVQPSQNPFTNPRPMQSPQSQGNGHMPAGMFTTPSSDGRRARGSIGYPNGMGMGILPTPDPTVGSCMSEEDKDVAIQLMRLGEMSNISHGRTSASTLDDTFSGRADVASSTGATSDSESDSDDELPPPRRQKLDLTGAAKQIFQTTEAHFKPDLDSANVSADDADYEGDSMLIDGHLRLQKPKTAPKHKASSSISKTAAPKALKAVRPPANIKAKKLPSVPGGPMSPASMPPSRKQSITSIANSAAPGEDEQPDLSTKPRCQRCRKSKKGCDRQRPCGRCRDAGLSADQCISEDEGNGRKGRYGRHMGVPIKKEEIAAPAPPSLLPAAPIAAAGAMAIDKAKKRKR
ncbi:hypothetical protein B0I35DRAFT_479161 [Stachybotrys elegans]|uniref:Zn(2)-C6 fungal-type domain-containing protein n=1 Tax=Stachybotrys elegans TaxID=80388 RepID=A0A8K0SRW4_9HYPO|nr:hypothetical protein B0I35DRAFT_479161 [Stachybotrys elegans]